MPEELPATPPRIAFVGLAFDQLEVDEVVDELIAVSALGPARYLVTPNVDHVVRLHRQHGCQGQVAEAYARATWCVCDSRILAALSRVKGEAMTVAPGSDVTRVLLDRLSASGEGRIVAVVGMTAAEFDVLAKKYAPLRLRHVDAPFGLARNPTARSDVCAEIKTLDAAFVLLAVGAPQQELIALEFSRLPETRGALLCIGASLEFLVEPQRRAPRVLQRMGLEWAFRLLQEPRRLWRRYLYEGPAIFPIALASTPRRVASESRGDA